MKKEKKKKMMNIDNIGLILLIIGLILVINNIRSWD